MSGTTKKAQNRKHIIFKIEKMMSRNYRFMYLETLIAYRNSEKKQIHGKFLICADINHNW